jgi:hypothetical protein
MRKTTFGRSIKFPVFVILYTLIAPTTFSQETVGRYATNDQISEFQSFPDEDGNVAVVYTTSAATTPRTYKTHFVSFSAAGQAKISLPFNIRLYGSGYTDSTFLFFMRTKEDEVMDAPKVDILEVHKQRPDIMGSKRIEYKDEELFSSFTDQGTFYLITLLKKPTQIRVRKFVGAEEPLTRTFPLTADQFKELTDDDLPYQFVHNRFELQLSEIYSHRKIFLWSGNLYLVAGFQKGLKKKEFTGLRLLELPIDAEVDKLLERLVPVVFSGSVNFFPLHDRLFLFESKKTHFSLSVFSLSTFEVEKTLTQENEGAGLLMGKYYDTDEESFWKPVYLPTGYSQVNGNYSLFDLLKKDPETLEKRLKKFNSGDPLVYVRKVREHLIFHLGEYHFPTTTYMGTNTMPGSTVSTPYGSFKTGGMTTTYHHTVASKEPAFSYVVSAIKVDLTGPVGLVAEPHSLEEVGAFADAKENERAAKKREIVSASTATFLIGFSNRDDMFTIWKWKRE